MSRKLKDIIKLFVPPILIKLIKKTSGKKGQYVSTINQIKKTDDILYILGNGPSLSESINKITNQLKIHDCIVVNNFCNTELFDEIKPKFYVIADPSNLGQLENLSESLKLETLKIADKLKSITWDMSFICPDFSQSGYLVNILKNNPHINIFFYNTQNVSKYDDLMHDWAENRISPPAQTVLNTCVYLGIFLKYKEIDILGMDLSWHEDLELDQKTNELFIVDKHFYGTKKRFATLDVNGIKPAHVHEYLQCSVNALKSFWDLKVFAEYQNVKVYNLSPHSWVDAFDRK